jgi:antitoxin component YwqK of YwqJK toxin-antitoxin module
MYYHQGKIEGTLTLYDKDGTIDETSEHVNGLQEGEAISYHSNNQVYRTSYWHLGKLDGILSIYSKEGVRVRDEYYNQGELSIVDELE